jgi:putative transposase
MVNRSTYYKWLNHKPSSRELENRTIRSRILELYSKTDKRLGVHKITECLRREYCINISCGRVYRLMKTMHLPKMSTVKPPKSTYSKVSETSCENLLAQNFNQPAPNMVWVSDFTYIRVANRFYYVCAILDLFARKIIAYKVSNKIDTQLAIDTLNIAIATRKNISGVIFHTDRGSQFTSKSFWKYLDRLNIVQSFSAKGHPYDNAVMECFFKYMKKEETNRRNYSTLDELKHSLFSYINGFYNSVRPHYHNNSLSPNENEAMFMRV